MNVSFLFLSLPSRLPRIRRILDIQPSNATLGPVVVELIPGAHGGGIVGEGEIGPVAMAPGGPRDLDDAAQRLLRLVVGEDVLKVKVLRRQVPGVEAGLVEELAFGVRERVFETRRAGIRHQLHFG